MREAILREEVEAAENQPGNLPAGAQPIGDHGGHIDKLQAVAFQSYRSRWVIP
jgi:hypothetical protein